MRRAAKAGLSFLIFPLFCAQAAVQPPGTPPPPPAARPGETSAYCPRLQDVTTVEACADVNVRIGHLELGTGRLAPPDPVFLGSPSPLVVNFELTRRGAATMFADGTRVSVYPNVRLSRYMSAILIGEGFRIDPAPPSGSQNGGTARSFGAGQNMTWRWNVVAENAPRHNLRIEVYLHIPVKNKAGSDNEEVTPVLIRSEQIPVTTTWGQWFEDIGGWVSRGTNGLKLLTGFLVALGALLAAWFALPGLRHKVRRRQAAPAAESR
jgi:hypothetical protein